MALQSRRPRKWPLAVEVQPYTLRLLGLEFELWRGRVVEVVAGVAAVNPPTRPFTGWRYSTREVWAARGARRRKIRIEVEETLGW